MKLTWSAQQNVVDAFLVDVRQEGAGSLRALLEQPGRREHADPGGYSHAAPCLRWRPGLLCAPGHRKAGRLRSV